MARVSGDVDGLVAVSIAVAEADAPALGGDRPEEVDRLVNGGAVDRLEDDDLLGGRAGGVWARRPGSERDFALEDGALEERVVAPGRWAGDLDARPSAVFPLEEAALAEDGAPIDVLREIAGPAGDSAAAIDLIIGAKRDDDERDEGPAAADVLSGPGGAFAPGFRGGRLGLGGLRRVGALYGAAAGADGHLGGADPRVGGGGEEEQGGGGGELLGEAAEARGHGDGSRGAGDGGVRLSFEGSSRRRGEV